MYWVQNKNHFKKHLGESECWRPFLKLRPSLWDREALFSSCPTVEINKQGGIARMLGCNNRHRAPQAVPIHPHTAEILTVSRPGSSRRTFRIPSIQRRWMKSLPRVESEWCTCRLKKPFYVIGCVSERHAHPIWSAFECVSICKMSALLSLSFAELLLLHVGIAFDCWSPVRFSHQLWHLPLNLGPSFPPVNKSITNPTVSLTLFWDVFNVRGVVD